MVSGSLFHAASVLVLANPQPKEAAAPAPMLHRHSRADGSDSATAGEELSIGAAGMSIWHHRGGR